MSMNVGASKLIFFPNLLLKLENTVLDANANLMKFFKVEGIIRKVLLTMTGLDVQRLPGTTFAKYILLKARAMALVHLKDELQHGEGGNYTLGTQISVHFLYYCICPNENPISHYIIMSAFRN